MTERALRPLPYVVLARRVRGFETLDDARRYALAMCPAIVCERHYFPDGRAELVEVLRHDALWDDAAQAVSIRAWDAEPSR